MIQFIIGYGVGVLTGIVFMVWVIISSNDGSDYDQEDNDERI